MAYKLPEPLAVAINDTLEDWRKGHKARRLWQHDATLWTGADEGHWMGWLGITEDQIAHGRELLDAAWEVRDGRFKQVVLLGMGGSSLCPEVMKMTFGRIDPYPELFVLDSTDPAQIKALETKIDLRNTLFIVSSKSGTTLEPNIFKQYFFDRVAKALGPQEAAHRFVAITDPGS